MTATVDRPVVQDRTPPNDLAAEQCVLGGMLQSKDAIGDVVEMLHADDFYQPGHAAVFDTIAALYNRGDPADEVTVADALARSGVLARLDGGASYLHTCIHTVPTAANAGYYARIVADLAVRRRLAVAGTRIVQSAWADGEVVQLVDRAQQDVYDVTGRRAGDDFVAFADLLQPTLDEVDAAGTRKGDSSAVPTGFADLDRLLGGGLHPGQLVVVAGRPGLGKSTCAAGDFVRACAIRHGLPAAVFSLEMSAIEVTTRLLSAEARVPLHTMRSGMLSEDDWTRLARRMGEIGEAPIFVDETPNMTLMEIRAKARRLKQRAGLRLAVVDYLQLMSSSGRVENRQAEVDAHARGLKLLAKDLNVPVVVASQLNRGPEQRTDKRPLLSDLRESGGIENHADVVILLHRDDYYDKESPRAGEADFIVAKHRNGPTDTITVAAQLHFSRFVDMAIV